MKLLNRMGDIKDNKIGYVLRLGLILLLIVSLTVISLAVVNAITKDRIAKNEIAFIEDALDNIFGGCDELKMVKGEYASPVVAVYEVYKKEIMWGYGIYVLPMGFKDTIGVVVGADLKGNCVGVEITSMSDTPSIAKKVKQDSFLSGFIGLDESNVLDYAAVSGATVSSNAIKNGVLEALKLDIFSDFDTIINEEEQLSDDKNEEVKDE